MSVRDFLEIPRVSIPARHVRERVRDHFDVHTPLPIAEVTKQAHRCMDCGVPFCQAGCPLGNVIPDFNLLVSESDWRGAYERLRATNNFPEFTGRVCPAPCESACVLGVIDGPVTIEQIERTIADQAYENGWLKPRPPKSRSGYRVAVVGSGPAGLACADQLNQAGHDVCVFERSDRPGGLLRYGIPDFKLEADIVDRRIALMQEEGVVFRTSVTVGSDVSVAELDEFDAIVIACGATRPRDLSVPGRELEGVHFAWDYLTQQNRINSGDRLAEAPISAAGKHVVVIGGGDTGSDCVGTANRQGAASVTQFELFPQPPTSRPNRQPWPFDPTVLKTTTSHEEGADRRWAVQTKAIRGRTDVEAVRVVDVELSIGENGRPNLTEVGDERDVVADLVLLAIGYEGPDVDWMVDGLGVSLDVRGNIATDVEYRTTSRKIFAAGDSRRGQSLVVWAISEGREVARSVDRFLTGSTVLPTRGPGVLPRVSAI